MGNPRPYGGSRLSVHRITGIVGSVGNTYVEFTVAVPARGMIRRLRAGVSSGTSINQVSIEVREVAGGTLLDIVGQYPLAAQPLDSDLSGAPVFYDVAQTGVLFDGRSGLLYIAASVDDATTDHTVVIYMDIEATA